MVDWIIKYWIAIGFSSITAGMVALYKFFCAIRLGVRALLHDRILQAYEHYHEKGYCPVHARENIYNMYVQYSNLGGNGTITDLINKIKLMDTEPKVQAKVVNIHKVMEEEA